MFFFVVDTCFDLWGVWITLTEAEELAKALQTNYIDP